jgi:hypothetical protein
LTNGTAGSADYTLQTTVTVPAGATTGTVSVPTTADTIDEVDETLALLMELFRLRVQLSTITMPLLWQRSPASATEGSDVVFDFTLSNPSAVDTSYTFVLTNGTAGSALHYYKRDSNCSAGATLERYRTNNCGYN